MPTSNSSAKLTVIDLDARPLSPTPGTTRLVIDCPKCKRTIWEHAPCQTCRAREAIEEQVYEVPSEAVFDDSDSGIKRKKGR